MRVGGWVGGVCSTRWQEWAIFAAEQERARRMMELRMIEEVRRHLWQSTDSLGGGTSH